MPKVSVLMPVFNGEKYLRKAIESVLCQTYKDFELLIINDNSMDNSVSIINQYNDERIRLISQSENGGLFKTHNLLFANSSGEYIKFVHQDDMLLQDSLEKFVELMDNFKNVAYIAACSEFIDENDNSLGVFQWGLGTDKYWEPNSLNQLSLRLGNIIGNPPSVIFRKSTLTDNPFDESYKNSSDWKLLICLAEKYPIYTTSQVLTRYRIHNESQSYVNHRSQVTVQEDLEIIHSFNYGENSTINLARHWRQHLHLFNVGIQLLLSGENSKAMEWFKYILINDLCIDQYESGRCKKDLIFLVNELRGNPINQDKKAILEKISSTLYLWLIRFGIGITYEFFDFLLNSFTNKSVTKLYVIGFELKSFEFLRMLCNLLKIDITGVWDVYNTAKMHPNSTARIQVTKNIDIHNEDAIVVISPDRINDFIIEYKLKEWVSANVNKYRVFRLREWVL